MDLDSHIDDAFWKQMMSTAVLPQSYKEAFRWFMIPGYEWAYRDIMYYCGVALIEGTYGYKNVMHGKQWIRRSAGLGYPEAMQLVESW